MSGEEIRFTITPNGIVFDASGFSGGKCISEFEKFKAHMKSIGVEITDKSREIKNEINNEETTSETVDNSY